ncbi:putative Phospholipid-Transporting Atpase Im [Manis pentadactyla]|nr:putative Phospholipid-Transporting Atpase Im [Manis pentadactyla]
MQAMLNSDYTFSQFHYLQRLLLVHGRWSYNCTCKFLSYFFYKNFAFTLVNFWYAFYSGFSAQDVNETWSLCFPELYEPGQHNLYFNKKESVKCLVHGIYSSFVLFFVPMGTVYNSVRSDGKEISDYQYFSLIVQTSLLWVVTMQLRCHCINRNQSLGNRPNPRLVPWNTASAGTVKVELGQSAKGTEASGFQLKAPYRGAKVS